MGSIWGRVIPAICLNPMFFMKQFWVGSISKMDCFRILIWPINNSGFLLVFWWFLWFGTAAKWFTSWLIYSKSWLMNVGRHSRSFFFSCLLSWFQWIMNALCFTFFFCFIEFMYIWELELDREILCVLYLMLFNFYVLILIRCLDTSFEISCLDLDVYEFVMEMKIINQHVSN